MSLSRFVVRRRRTTTSSDKPQVERIEHANLERPGARLHPSALLRATGSILLPQDSGWTFHGRGPAPWPRG